MRNDDNAALFLELVMGATYTNQIKTFLLKPLDDFSAVGFDPVHVY